jgi:hypothetical protein
MWLRRRYYFGGRTKFFRIIFSHETLGNYFQTNFALMQHHKYSLTELDNLMPWERQVYIDLLLKHLDEEAERVKEERRKASTK